jgi:hypothetical protein
VGEADSDRLWLTGRVGGGFFRGGWEVKSAVDGERRSRGSERVAKGGRVGMDGEEARLVIVRRSKRLKVDHFEGGDRMKAEEAGANWMMGWGLEAELDDEKGKGLRWYVRR